MESFDLPLLLQSWSHLDQRLQRRYCAVFRAYLAPTRHTSFSNTLSLRAICAEIPENDSIFYSDVSQLRIGMNVLLLCCGSRKGISKHEHPAHLLQTGISRLFLWDGLVHSPRARRLIISTFLLEKTKDDREHGCCTVWCCTKYDFFCAGHE